jgi:tetratricopeptide (TPR) repeat protein
MAGQPQASGGRRFKVLAVALLIVVALGALAVVGHKVRKRMMVQSALAEGTAAFEQGDWDTACRMLGRYVSVHPENTDVLVKYAEAQLAMRPLAPANIGQAIGAYRRIFNDKPTDEHAFRRLILLYEAAGNFADLGYVAGQRLQQAPDDPPAVVAQAKDLIYRQKPQEAQTALAALIEKMTATRRFGPDYVEACVLSAGALRLSGKPGATEAAVQVLTQAIEHEPQCALALVQRASIERELAQPSSAPSRKPQELPASIRTDLERAEALASLDPRVHLGLAREWLAQRDFAHAKACLEAARQLDEQAVQQYLINPADWTAAQFEVAAGLSLASGAAADGVSLAERMLEQLKGTPQRTQLLPIAVELLLAGGKTDSASEVLTEYSDALELQPNVPNKVERLAYLRALVARAQGQTYTVINLLEPIIDSANTPPSASALLAEAYAKTGQNGRMAKLLSDEAQTGSLGPTARKRLARWKGQHGAWNEVRALLLPLEQADPPDIEARVLRLGAELNTIADAKDASAKQLSELRQAAVAVREQYPQRVDVRLLLAAIADRQDRIDEAVAGLEQAAQECEDPVTPTLALARLYSGKNQPEKAKALLTSLCEQHGTTAAPWLALSELLVNCKQTAAARETLQHGIEAVAPPENRQLAIRRASLELIDGDRTSGVQELTRLAREDSSDVRTRGMLLEIPEVLQDAPQQLVDEIKAAEGDAGLQWRYQQARLWLAGSGWRGQRQQIEDLLKYCTDADPQWSAASLALGGMYEQLAEWTKAETTYANGFRATSDQSLADRWLAVLQRERRFDEARDVLERLRKVLDERALAARRIDLALSAGQYEQALSELELRATGDSRDPRDLIRLAELTYLQGHNASRAFEYLDQATQLGAEPATVARSRVAILRSEGRKDEAVAVLNDLVAAQPTPESFLLRASYYAGMGENELAERDFAAISNVSKDAFGPAALGEFYARAGRLDEAISAWEEGLQNYPDSDMLKRGLAKARLLRDAPGDRERIAQLLTDLESRLPDDTELLWLRAMDQMRSGEPKALQAVRQGLHKALTSAPAKAEVYRGLARIATQLEDYVTARDLVQHGLQVNPGDADLSVQRAWAELDLNNLAEARRIAENLASEAGTVAGWEVFVECARRQGDKKALARAAAALQPLVNENASDERLQILRAQALAESGDLDTARAALEEFRQSDAGQKSLAAVLALEEIALQKSDFAAAEQSINAAAELKADAPIVARGRLRLFAAQKRLDDIVQFARGLPEDNQDWVPEMLVSAALALSSSPAHLKAAVDLCEHATKLAPERVPAHLVLADLLYRTGDKTTAVQEYRRALQINPTHPDGLNNLAWVLAEQGSNYDEALNLSQQAVALQPKNVNFRDTLAFVLQQMPNRLPQARQELLDVVDLSPADSLLRAKSLFRLAQVCYKLNDVAPITGYLNEALTIARDQGEAFSPAERTEIDRLLQAVSAPVQ